MNSVLPSISVSTSHVHPSHTSNNEHTHPRVFIGPMPEKVVSQTEAHVLKQKKRGLFHTSTVQPEDDDMSQIIKENAFHFFIREGGKLEDWEEGKKQSITEEMVRRWRDSEWGTIWSRRRQRKETRQTSHWVGSSFEIGRLLGVNILQKTGESKLDGSSTRKIPLPGSQTHSSAEVPPPSFVTAPSHPTPSTSRVKSGVATSELGDSDTPDAEHSTPATSSTTLLRPTSGPVGTDGHVLVEPRTEVFSRPMTTAPSLSTTNAGIVGAHGKGKARLVRYADVSERETHRPAPPSEVLERTGADVEDTSAGAASVSSNLDLEWGDVVLRDRMLIRVCYTKSESVNSHFDEVQNRTASHLDYANWAEYMVAWRKDCIEIYRDHSMPGKEWVTGHKHLAYIIPLKSSRTKLSLYSFVDLTFCLMCPPTSADRDTSKSRWNFGRAKEGTNIFIFKVKSRSRAYDWTWQLWQHLGGVLPKTIEIRNPRMNTKVKIDIPMADSERIYTVFSRKNVLELCMDSLRSVNDWKNVIERELMEGKSLELAWRVDTNLDWIWLDGDIDGRPRQSAVLCGLALKQSTRPATLEVRLAEHYPTYVHLKNGNRLHEPPAIEGYLERVRPATQTKQGIYLSTHDGNIFTFLPNHANPPSPPGLAPNLGDMDSYAKMLRQAETQRGALQVMNATGVADLRSILLIRRAFHVMPLPSHSEVQKEQNDDILFGIWSQPEEITQADERDEGGEEGISKSEDKPRLRMRRSFELLLTTGHVIRFEAYSCRVAVEWIERLRALVLYWKQRHRIDAREEMDLAQARRPRLTPQTRALQDADEHPPEPPADISAPLPALGSLYNWCVLRGCKPVIRGGKVYMRRGLHGQYKLVQLFLISGHLVQFRIVPKSSLHTAMRKKTNLVDAYVCSGYFAALALPKGQYSASNSVPRRYQDGLEADDPEEDTLFMVWYHPQAPNIKKATTSPTPKDVPALSAKRKLLVFRTRSKLERDAWCWALNCEIEKIVRTQKEREDRLRETGGLMKL